MDSTIERKILIKGIFNLISPLIIGSGEKGDQTDLLVLKDEEMHPYIPGTSFIGALKHWFADSVGKSAVNEKDLALFYGGDYENAPQSAFLVDDLYFKSGPKEIISTRDGVKINPETGTADKGAKYNYEIINAHTSFEFSAELTVRKGFPEDTFMKILSTLLIALKEGKISFGAMTNKGFGKGKLRNVKVMNYDFENSKDVALWILSKEKEPISPEDLMAPYPANTGEFEVEGIFRVRKSLMIRSYSTDINDPDMVNIKNYNENGKLVPIIPGTSIKGTIRARMLRILRTLDHSITEEKEYLKKFLGYVSTNNPKEQAYKSTLMINETEVHNGVTNITQHRTKIDRFTQGVIEGALFDEVPLWSDNNTYVKINATINKFDETKKWQAGLLLLAIKDLWNADLPIGGEKNVGRGRLIGKKVKIQNGEKEVIIEDKDGKPFAAKGDPKFLESCVEALHEKIKEVE